MKQSMDSRLDNLEKRARPKHKRLIVLYQDDAGALHHDSMTGPLASVEELQALKADPGADVCRVVYDSPAPEAA